MRQIGFLLVVLIATCSVYGQVGVGTETPDTSAALDIVSTSKGFLPPRMTATQRDAISVTSGSTGLIIFNTDSGKLNVYDGNIWHAIVETSLEGSICTTATTLNEFLTCLQTNYTPNQTLGYSSARDIMYSVIDINESNQELKGIYTDYTIVMDYSTDPDPSIHAFNQGINAEHIYPQSMGAGDEPARSDMINLFPSRINVNSSRGNCPFGDIVDTDTETWFYTNQIMNTIPLVNIDFYTEIDQDASYPLLSLTQQCAIEPPENKKGDIARILFYFYTIYNATNVNSYVSYANEDFFNYMKITLLSWHANDPVDQSEIDRNTKIAVYQGNSNPFVLDSSLATRMFN
ncbi:endonuclease [uncultured Psychroserpens sp.]|uniref:endonuclease n=1 Tax=uncultured Psychroserpens sp. TaxID=255436 RepID=UPI00262A296F|nr:endonuclease [uncultured Psychroserpens sp.]